MYWKLDQKSVDAITGQVYAVYEYYHVENNCYNNETLLIKKWFGNNLEDFLEFYKNNKKL